MILRGVETRQFFYFESNSIFPIHFTLNVLFPGTIIRFGTQTSPNKSGALATFCNIAIMVSALSNKIFRKSDINKSKNFGLSLETNILLNYNQIKDYLKIHL